MSNNLTLRILKNTEFINLYKRFMLNTCITDEDTVSILSIAIILLNLKDEVLQHLGYRIIVKYCNRYNAYYPLYEVAINLGLYPISKFIEDHYIQEKDRNFFTCWNDAHVEQYKKNNTFLSEQQSHLNQFFYINNDNSVSIVAPTSYGKSELILEAVNAYKNKRICIITSTKALLMQTKKRIKESGIVDGKKIIIHPEMYNNDTTFVAVLTQERLLRLLKVNNSIAFDCIVVDEAHELFEDTQRTNTLASTIIVCKKRNHNAVIKFLTPFVSEINNLQPRYVEIDMMGFVVSEYIKSEYYILHNIRDEYKTYLYDQFMDMHWKLFDLPRLVDERAVVKKFAERKNIVYINKPIDIEQFALDLAKILPDVQSQEIDLAIQNISDYLNPQYNMLICLKKGIVYHHGSIPDNIRIYIEDLYKRIPEIKYIITSSTLLSGVNLPAEKMFILDIKKGGEYLRAEEFKNLIGRVCRFKDIFSVHNGNLNLLEPHIHIVFGKYFSKNADCKKYLHNVAKADKRIIDNVDNVLLKNTEITKENEEKLKDASEYIENYENGIIEDYSDRYTITNIGKACIMNGIRDIDIFTNEVEMQKCIEEYFYKSQKIDNTDDLMDVIRNCFMKFVIHKGHEEVARLKNLEACDFYAMMIDWQMDNKSYPEMIYLFLQYWRELYKKNPDSYVYVGRWGNIDKNGSHGKKYILLKTLDKYAATNLAIVRIKEEKDFIDNNITRYIEAINDLGYIDETFYMKVKYGTDDSETICLLKNGLSLSLSHLLIEKYRECIDVYVDESNIVLHPELIDKMIMNKENLIFIYEAQNNV